MKSAAPHANGIGQPVRRKEDLRLVRGAGRYSDDLRLPGQAYATVLRSPHAHARIVHIDTSAARAAPGVLGVLTGIEVAADGLRPILPIFSFLAVWSSSARCPTRSCRTRTAARSSTAPIRCWRRIACAISARRWPWWWRKRGRRQGRRRADRDRLRAAAGGHSHRGGRRAGCAAAVGSCALQCLPRCGGGRQGGNGCRLRARRPRRLAQHLDPARHRRADGNAFRGRQLRRRNRALHALCRQRRLGAHQARDRGDPRRAVRCRACHRP